MQYKITIKGIDEQVARFQACPKAVRKAQASACNKLAAMGVTAARKAITDIYNIKAKDVRAGLKLIKAKSGGKDPRLFAIIDARGRGLPLYDFKVLPKNPPNQKGVPIARRKKTTAQVLKAEGRKALPHMFVQRMPGSEHTGVFFRTGKKMTSNPKRDAIKEQYVFSVATMFEKKAIDAIGQVVDQKGASVFQHELKYHLGLIQMGGPSAATKGGE